MPDTDLFTDPMQALHAERLARSLHEGQTDKSGAPYVLHLERVAGRMTTDTGRAVAWLHDTIEDTAATAADLLRYGVRSDVVANVEALTRRATESYAEYIERLRTHGSRTAIAVKQADLTDHLESTPDAISPSLRRRYLNAREALRGRTLSAPPAGRSASRRRPA